MMHETLADYLLLSLEQFLQDPPDSNFQAGYLAALINVANEHAGLHHPTLTAAQALLSRYATTPGQRWLVVVPPEGNA